jgi:hypothetical protein
MRSKFNVVFPVRLRPEHVKTIERAAAVSGDCPSALVRRGGLAEARRVLREVRSEDNRVVRERERQQDAGAKVPA